MATNQLLPFGTAGGANVLDYTSYNALASRLTGFVAGVAQSQQLNTVWRQASFTSAMVGQFTSDYSGNNVLDDGNVGTYETNFVLALKNAMGAYFPVSLTAALDLYVRTDGNDSNNGLANTAAGAFLTIQAAINSITRRYNTVGFLVTIHVGNGTYNGDVTVDQATALKLLIQGNNATPASCVVNGLIRSSSGSAISVEGFKLTNASGGLNAVDRSSITWRNIIFACGGYHMNAAYSSYITCAGGMTTYSIISGGTAHLVAGTQSTIEIVGQGLTITGSPAFSFAFAWANNGTVLASGAAVSGGGTTSGQRYVADVGGLIYVAGAGANVFPGSVAGSTASNGGYF